MVKLYPETKCFLIVLRARIFQFQVGTLRVRREYSRFWTLFLPHPLTPPPDSDQTFPIFQRSFILLLFRTGASLPGFCLLLLGALVLALAVTAIFRIHTLYAATLYPVGAEQNKAMNAGLPADNPVCGSGAVYDQGSCLRDWNILIGRGKKEFLREIKKPGTLFRAFIFS